MAIKAKQVIDISNPQKETSFVSLGMPSSETKLDTWTLRGYAPDFSAGTNVIPVAGTNGKIGVGFIPDHQHELKDFANAVNILGGQGNVNIDILRLGNVQNSEKSIYARTSYNNEDIMPCLRYRVLNQANSSSTTVSGLWEFTNDGISWGPISPSNISILTEESDNLENGNSFEWTKPSTIEGDINFFIRIMCKDNSTNTWYQYPTVNPDMSGWGFEVAYTDSSVRITNRTGETKDVKVYVYIINGVIRSENLNIFSEMSGYVTLVRNGNVHSTQSTSDEVIYDTLFLPDVTRHSSMLYISFLEEVIGSSDGTGGLTSIRITDGNGASVARTFGDISVSAGRKVTSHIINCSELSFNTWWKISFSAHVNNSSNTYKLHRVTVRSKPVSGLFTELLTTRVNANARSLAIGSKNILEAACYSDATSVEGKVSWDNDYPNKTFTMIDEFRFISTPLLVEGDHITVLLDCENTGTDDISNAFMEVQCKLFRGETNTGTSETVRVSGQGGIASVRLAIPEITAETLSNTFKIQVFVRSGSLTTSNYAARVNAYSILQEL